MMKLLIDEYPLVVMPTLAKNLGINEAILLQQVHYWLQRSDMEAEGRKWVHKTVDEWCQEIPWVSKRTMERLLAGLTKKGILISKKFRTAQWDHSKSYSIAYDHVLLHDVPGVGGGSDTVSLTPSPTAASRATIPPGRRDVIQEERLLKKRETTEERIKTGGDRQKCSETTSAAPDEVEGDEEALIRLYGSEVKQPSLDGSRSQARRNVARLLGTKTAIAADLYAAVRNYAERCAILGTGAEYRKNAGNFFGKDATYRDFLPGVYERPAPPMPVTRASRIRAANEATMRAVFEGERRRDEVGQ